MSRKRNNKGGSADDPRQGDLFIHVVSEPAPRGELPAAGAGDLDVPLRDIIDLAFRVEADGIYFEAANPRHGHEWKVFRDVKLPAGKILIPGVVDSKTNYIEHPDLIADRLANLAGLVGRENVIAGTDCGFGTSVGPRHVAPSIAWAKLEAMVEGARIASKELLG